MIFVHADFACDPRGERPGPRLGQNKMWKSSIFHDVFKIVRTSRPLMTSAIGSLETYLEYDSFCMRLFVLAIQSDEEIQ